MKTDQKQVPTRFGPEVGFEIPALPFRAAQTTALDRMKERLLREAIETATDVAQNTRLRRAANDAAALAWATGHPLLFFPELFAEKGRTARRQVRQQLEVHRRSAQLMQEAA